jgi:ketosteroid isomerase-like protein
MSQENVEVSRSFYEAFLAGDPSSAKPFVDADFEFVPARATHIFFPAPSHGLEEFNKRFTEIASQFESYEARPEEFIEAGDDTVVALLHRITVSHGVRVEDRIAQLITLRGGRISRIVSFANLEEALEAAGLSE